MKRLILLRHAKSDWSDGNLTDHDRPLNARGQDAAARMGRYLREQGLGIDHIICSTARRAVETCVRMMAAADLTATVTYDRRLYLAMPGDMLKVAAERGGDAKTVMLIGHNPGMADCAAQLALDGDAALIERMRTKFPTAALALIEYAGDWQAMAAPGAGGRLRLFVVPRELA